MWPSDADALAAYQERLAGEQPEPWTLSGPIRVGDWPADRRGATSPLELDGVVVARWVRTRTGTRPLVVHPGWRVDLDSAVDVVLATTARWRTPAPLRVARRAARTARSLTSAG